MRGYSLCLRAVLILCIVYFLLGIFRNWSSTELPKDIPVEAPPISKEKPPITSPSDAIPDKWREYCQFLEHPIHGWEGLVKPRSGRLGKNLKLRGLVVLTRHGERAALIEDAELMKTTSCAPYHETDRVAFRKYRQLITSPSFEDFMQRHPTLRNGSYGIIPHQSSCQAGQLTAEGALQLHRLGTFLHGRYSNTSLFKAPRIKISAMTTPYNRTLQSLTGVISGFLFPQRAQLKRIFVNFSGNHFLCADEEAYCRCSKAGDWRKQYEEEYAQFFKLRSPAGLQRKCQIFKELPATRSFVDPWQFMDAMVGFYICRRENLPCNARGDCVSYGLMDEIYAETTRRGEQMFIDGPNYIAQRVQLAEANSVIGKWLHVIEALQKDPEASQIKLLSAHDSTLGPLLRVLRILPQDPPRYASRVVLEVYSDPSNALYFRLLFNGEVFTEKLPFCRENSSDGLCAVEELENFYKAGLWKLSKEFLSFRALCGT